MVKMDTEKMVMIHRRKKRKAEKGDKYHYSWPGKELKDTPHVRYSSIFWHDSSSNHSFEIANGTSGQVEVKSNRRFWYE